MKETKENMRGITLIALVVTIIILLILSGITINMLLGENGIIRTAQEAKNTWEGSISNEQKSIQNLVNELNEIMNEDGGTEKKSTLEQLIDAGTIVQFKKKVEDKYDNPVVVPKGFKVTNDGITVPEGVVIEDSHGNQFVWIPVGTVHKDSNPENDVIIQLGRYTFDRNNGTPTPEQLAYTDSNPKNYINTDGKVGVIEELYTELSIQRDGTVDESNHLNDLNATAKDLAGFVESVRDNGGYYLARYEASYGSGDSVENWKPLSKISIGVPREENQEETSLTTGMLWNYVTQLEASKICQNMYKVDDTVGVESDLINSYAWDTAIVFIQKMGNSNYANANRDTTGNTVLKNTGETGDKACNVYDMATNVAEWTTEYCNLSEGRYAYPCSDRGGAVNTSDFYVAHRYRSSAYYDYSHVGFRLLLYIEK